jgi:hypothetical protein
MAAVTKVLIHSQGKTEGSLRLAIDHYRPNMVFLISNPETNAPKFRDWVIAIDSIDDAVEAAKYKAKTKAKQIVLR